MRFGTWNVRSFYRAGSFKAVARELGRYKLEVVGGAEGQVGQRGLCNCGGL